MYVTNNPTEKRTKLLRVKLTRGEENVLERLADYYHTNISDFVRERLFRMADYTRNEIHGAVNKVKKAYQKVQDTIHPEEYTPIPCYEQSNMNNYMP